MGLFNDGRIVGDFRTRPGIGISCERFRFLT